MKPNIHPNYQKVAFRDQSTGEIFLISSTITSDRTVEVDGETYPLVTMDVTSASHPFYTGKQRDGAVEGRISRFKNKYGLE